MDYRYKIVVTFKDGQSTVIDQDEIDSLEVNLEHGYDVDGFIAEALRAREARLSAMIEAEFAEAESCGYY